MLEQIKYINDNVIGYYRVPETWDYYNLLEKPFLYLNAEHDGDVMWDDKPENFISILAYKKESMLTERLHDKSEIEIFVRTYKIRLKINPDELDKLKAHRDSLHYYLMDREIIDSTEGIYTISQVIEKIKETVRI